MEWSIVIALHNICTYSYGELFFRGKISSQVARIHLDSCKDFCENLWILFHSISVFPIFFYKN